MSSRCTTRKPAASHTFFPPASSSGSTGPPGAAIPIVAPGAIARGLMSRGPAALGERPKTQLSGICISGGHLFDFARPWLAARAASRRLPRLEITVVGRAAEVVAAARPAARSDRRRFIGEAGPLGQTELAAALIGEVAELRVLPVELELDRAGRSVALLGDDQLGEPVVLFLRVVDLVAVDERNQIRVLLDRARLAQVAHVGPALVRIALLGAAVQL